jgi:hypothetical protein
MNPKAKGEPWFEASDASNETALERMSWHPSFAPTPLASFFGPFSTAC